MHNNIKWLSFRCLCAFQAIWHKKIRTQLIIMLVSILTILCSTYRCTQNSIFETETQLFRRKKKSSSANNFYLFLPYTNHVSHPTKRTSINFTHIYYTYTRVCKQLSEPKKNCVNKTSRTVSWMWARDIKSTIFYCKNISINFSAIYFLFEKHFR